MPIPKSELLGFFFSSFFRQTYLGEGDQHSPTILNYEKSGKKHTHTSGRSSQGHIEDVRKISRSDSNKRRGHSPGNTLINLRFNVNQPVGI